MELGRKIAQRRASLDISQRALAIDCDLSQPSISSIERGDCNPSLLTTLLIAAALDWTLDQMFDGVTSLVGANLEN